MAIGSEGFVETIDRRTNLRISGEKIESPCNVDILSVNWQISGLAFFKIENTSLFPSGEVELSIVNTASATEELRMSIADVAPQREVGIIYRPKEIGVVYRVTVDPDNRLTETTRADNIFEFAVGCIG